MFHVNAWGIPYAAPLTGAKLVFPGAALDGASLYELFESEARDSTSAVPTVWLGLLNHMQQNKLRFSTLKHDDDRRLGLPAGDDQDACRRSSACTCCTAGA